MFSHVMIGTNDLDRAKTFYDKLLGTLGVRPAVVDGHRIFYRTKTGTFGVSKPIDGKAATHANGGTIGFLAQSPEEADAWHAAGNPEEVDSFPGEGRIDHVFVTPDLAPKVRRAWIGHGIAASDHWPVFVELAD